ncbi:MAG: hypothetical protein AAF747_09280, partial [Planctomycetota bacterium]
DRTPVANQAAGLGDAQLLEITWNESEREVSVVRHSGSNASQPEVIARGIDELSLRYFDGNRWSSSFDSSSTGTLPALVEIAVWVGEADRTELTVQPRRDATATGTFDQSIALDRDFADADFDDINADFDPRAARDTEQSDDEIEEQPTPPTRIRVIAIPDAAEGGGS